MSRILDDIKLDYSDVLLLPKRSSLSSRAHVNLSRNFSFKHSSTKYTGVPIIAANMDSTGTIEMAKAFKPYHMPVALHKFHDEGYVAEYFDSTEIANPHTFYTMGVTEEDFHKFLFVNSEVKEEYIDMHTVSAIKYLCIDVANGYSPLLVDTVKRVRNLFPNMVIMAGNVVTGDMVHDLLLNGADIVKIGIGPGSVCTTRRMTGVGYPQLSAVMECSDAAHGIKNGLICADGGITCPGDIAKAFAGGADFVMCGGLFAGHDECEGEIIFESVPRSPTFEADRIKDPYGAFEVVQVPKSMKFHGMSSREAMEQHYGNKASYRASEGKEVEVPYKGKVSGTIEEILGGLRSTGTYIGASELKHFSKCATFVRANRQLNNIFGN